jgi:hypothetical protein
MGVSGARMKVGGMCCLRCSNARPQAATRQDGLGLHVAHISCLEQSCGVWQQQYCRSLIASILAPSRLAPCMLAPCGVKKPPLA